MGNDVPARSQPEPGRLARPLKSDDGGWGHWLPGLQTARRYELAWLPHDIVAGLVLTTMLVPVGIAYAVASGVPGIYGLYATIVAAAGLRAIRSEPHPGAGAGLVAGGADPRRRAAAFGWRPDARRRPGRVDGRGIRCGLHPGGALRLGFITELLSKPIRYGYMNGIAFVVIVSQLPKLLGVSIDSVGPLRDLWQIGWSVLDGAANWTAFAIGAGTLAVILLLKPWRRVPGLLIAVVAATVAVGLFDLGASAGVKVLGELPQGLPAFAVPWIGQRGSSCRGDRRLLP